MFNSIQQNLCENNYCMFIDLFTVKSLLENLLQKLIQLQSVLLLQNSETQYIESGQKK